MKHRYLIVLLLIAGYFSLAAGVAYAYGMKDPDFTKTAHCYDYPKGIFVEFRDNLKGHSDCYAYKESTGNPLRGYKTYRYNNKLCFVMNDRGACKSANGFYKNLSNALRGTSHNTKY